MPSIILGYGEIGKAVDAVIGADYIVDPSIKRVGNMSVTTMHVCFPYSEKFNAELQNYIKAYKPRHIVIYSTVPIGTTKAFPKAVHSPIEGKHPDLEMSIRQMERWIGYNDPIEGQFFYNYFQALNMHTRLVESSDFTEALKLLSTTEYGINLMFADYKARVAEAIGMDYELTKEWNRVYNQLYKDLGMEKRFQKFVLDPPNGKIGGHCIIPNVRLLNKEYPSKLLDRLEDYA